MPESEMKAARKTQDERRAKWREYSRNRREGFASAGLCAKCGKAEPVPGKSACAACLAKEREAAARHRAKLGPEGREKRREYIRQWLRENRALRTKTGVCVRCGKEDAVPGRIHCPACLERLRESTKRKYQKRRAILAEAERIVGAGELNVPRGTIDRIREEWMKLPDWRKEHPEIKGRLLEILFDAFYMEQFLARIYGEADSLAAAPCKGWREFVMEEIARSKKAALIEWGKAASVPCGTDGAAGTNGGQGIAGKKSGSVPHETPREE